MPKKTRRRRKSKFSLITKGVRWLFVVLFTGTILAACASKPQPSNIDDICCIFRQYPDWYWATQKAEAEWGVPVHVQMAFVHQESSFRGSVKPERTKLFGFIPWTRPSSAKGYSQALSPTWQCYKDKTGKYWVSRSNFPDAVDFVGWYANEANRRANIPKHDAYNLYLAYHEGVGGYQRNTYQEKQWLIDVARRVNSRSSMYQTQLRQCQATLKKKPWYQFW